MKQKIVAVVLAASLIVANALLPASVRAQGVEASAPEPQADQEIEALSTEDGGNYDITKPVINSVSIDKQGQTVKAGTSITISVDAYDADSGIKSVSVTVRDNDSSSLLTLTYNETTKKYETTALVGKDGYSGKFVITRVSVVDNSDNATAQDISECWVNIEGMEKVDTEAPQITAVQLSKGGVALQADSIVKPGDTIHISVQATDNVGLDKTAQPTVQLAVSPSASNDAASASVTLFYQESNGCYEGSLNCTEEMFPGNWQISSISGVNDTSGNVSGGYASDSLLSGCKFTFQNDGFDTEAPVCKSFTIEKAGEFVQPGEKLTISVQATDDVGIKSVIVYMTGYADNDNGLRKTIALEATGVETTYQGVFEITEDTYPCEWMIDMVKIEDQSGNTGYGYSRYFDGVTLVENLSQYVNVKNGNTFVVPTYTVHLQAFKEDLGTIEVARRSSLAEIPTDKALSIPGLTFKGWRTAQSNVDDLTEKYGFTEYSIKYVYPEYDKIGIFWDIYTREPVRNITVFIGYAELGSEIPIPKIIEIPGYKNIEWDEGIAPDSVTVKEHYMGMMYLSVKADVDENAPSEDDPNTPADNPGNTDPGNNGSGDNNTGSDINPGDSTNTNTTPSNSLTEEQIAKIISDIESAKDGATLNIPMDKATIIPKEILEAARGKDLSLVLQMDGYSWKIDGKSIQNTSLQDIDLKVIRHTDDIPTSVISRLAGNNPVEQITLVHDGHFGFVAELTLNVGKEYAGYKGNLYYYDSDGKMVFIDAGTVRENGEVSLSFSHASEYAIVLDGSKATSPKTGDFEKQTNYTMIAVILASLSAAALVVVRKRMKG